MLSCLADYVDFGNSCPHAHHKNTSTDMVQRDEEGVITNITHLGSRQAVSARTKRQRGISEHEHRAERETRLLQRTLAELIRAWNFFSVPSDHS